MKINKLLNRVIFVMLISGVSVAVSGYEFHDYNNSRDPVVGIVRVDPKLSSDFFNTYEESLPWHVIKLENETFESVLGETVRAEDTIPVEHTSNCVSTHQGRHTMEFCYAEMKNGVLILEVYGGLPAYASSLLIKVTGDKYHCFFRAVYPAPVQDVSWRILSSELILKTNDMKKGDRAYAKISVMIEEQSTWQGKTEKQNYTIKGYLKPVVH